jgi:hypothetical protein
MRPLVGSFNLKAYNAAIQLRTLRYRSLITVLRDNVVARFVVAEEVVA